MLRWGSPAELFFVDGSSVVGPTAGGSSYGGRGSYGISGGVRVGDASSYRFSYADGGGGYVNVGSSSGRGSGDGCGGVRNRKGGGDSCYGGYFDDIGNELSLL